MSNLETKWRIKFYLESRKNENEDNTNSRKIPLYMFVTFGKDQRLQFYTRESLFANQIDDRYLEKVKEDRSYFRPVKSQVNESRSINGRLEKIAQETVRLIEMANKSNPPIKLTSVYLKTALKAWINEDILATKDIVGMSLAEAMDKYKEYSLLHHAPKTVSGFKQVRDNVESFIKTLSKKNPVLCDINQTFIDGFETFMINKKVNDKNLSNNTLAKNLKKLKTLLLWCRDKGWYEYNLIIKYKENEGAIIPLTLEEITQLENAKLSDISLERLRDVFIVGILTGLRYGDLKALKKNDFFEGRIWFYQKKNGATFQRTIKLVPKALAIVEKYKDLPGEMLLPAYSDPNRKLKDIFAEAKLERQVSIVRKFAGGRIEETVVLLSKLAHSHMERKTFINLGINMGIPDAVLKSITGHSKGSSAFRRYYNISDSDKDDAMDTHISKI